MPAGRVQVDLDEGRYDRQELIAWWDQTRLREARVLVVGAGALGNELVKNLALLGVGTILVCDLDRVENSNLSRCVLFGEQDEGRLKAEVVAEAAGRLNPEVQVLPLVGDVRLAVGLSVFERMDVVLGGLDNREARLHVNQACWKAGTPWVDGAIEGLLGVVRAFVPPDSACYECTMSEVDRQILAARRACTMLTREQMEGGKVPTTATTSSVIAGIQVQEAVKLLHRNRLGYEFAGRGFVFNGLTHDSYVVTYPRVEDCLSHDRYEGLGEAPRIPATAEFATVLELARTELGAEAVLDLEADIVVSMQCPECDDEEVVLRPLNGMPAGAAECPSCGAERTLRIAHVVDESDPVLMSTSYGRLGLAPGDVVTARLGFERRHYILGAETAAL